MPESHSHGADGLPTYPNQADVDAGRSAVPDAAPIPELPSTTVDDAGKTLAVNDAGDGYELAAPAGGSISAASGNFRITTATVPNSSWTVLSLGTPNGDAVLDLTDPANPIATVAGLYTVTASIKHTGDDITHNMFLEIDLDNNGEDGFTVAAVPMVNDGNGTVHGTCTYYVPLGGVINIACQQSSGSSVTLSTTQSRVVVSVIPCDRATLPN